MPGSFSPHNIPDSQRKPSLPGSFFPHLFHLLQIKHAQNDLPPPEIFLHRLESIACLDGLQSGEQSSHLNRYLIIAYSSPDSDTGRTDSSSSSCMPSKSLSVGVMAAKSSGMPVISTFWEYSPVLVL